MRKFISCIACVSFLGALGGCVNDPGVGHARTVLAGLALSSVTLNPQYAVSAAAMTSPPPSSSAVAHDARLVRACHKYAAGTPTQTSNVSVGLAQTCGGR